MSDHPGVGQALQGADGRRHFLALDSLRGICACIVAVYHLHAASLFSLVPVISNGFLFVDFFFVLSGFVIMRSYGDKLRSGMSIARFMGLRLGRVYPLHVFVLLVLLAMQLALLVLHRSSRGPDDTHSILGFIQALLLLQTFTADGVGNWNPASWSISAEFWTYLAFAFVCRLLPKGVPIILLLAVGVAPFAMEAATDRHINACFNGSLARCFYGFSMGALCLMLWERTERFWAEISFPLASVMEIAATIACCVVVGLIGANSLSYLCPFVFTVAVLIFAGEGGALSALLKKRPALLLGMLSYSIYMVHETVFARLDDILAAVHLKAPRLLEHGADPLFGWSGGDVLISLVYTFGSIGGVILVAYTTFRFVEEPGRLWSRRLAQGGSRSSA